jgi:hypothetical protein
MQSTQDSGNRKILSAVSHGSIFFNTLILSIGIPIGIYLLSTDSVVKESSKEAISFHLNMWFWYAVFGLLAWLLIGIPFLIVVATVNFVMPILAIIHSFKSPDTVYRYPFIFRLF